MLGSAVVVMATQVSRSQIDATPPAYRARRPHPSSVWSCPRASPSRPLPSLTFRRIRALALLVALILLITGIVNLVQAGIDRFSTTAPAAEVAPAPLPPPTSESATAQLTEAVAHRNAGARGRLAVIVSDLDTGVTAAVGADEGFTTASIVKVDIAATLVLQSDGTLHARRTVRGPANDPEQ